MRGIGQRFGMKGHCLDLPCEFLGGEAGLADRARAACCDDFARVRGLMIVGGDRKRHEDCGAADRGQFGNGRGASPADEQVRARQARRHVLEVSAKLGRDFVSGIARAHRFKIFRAALLRHLQAMAQRGRQHRKPVGHNVRQHRRALASASHQHAKQRVLGEFGERFAPQSQHFGSHRIADKVDFAPQLGIKPVNLVVRGGDGIDPLGKEAIDPAQHRVLLVDHCRDFRPMRRDQRRQRGIAAEADHTGRLEAVEQAQRHRAALQDRAQPLERGQRILAHAPRRQHMRRQAGRLARNARAALVSHQRHVVATPVKLHRQRERGQQVPAGAACRENKMPRHAHLRNPSPRLKASRDR